MFSAFWNACQSLFNCVKNTIEKITRPATSSLVADAIIDVTRNRRDLIVENTLLRQQLTILNRQVKRPKFTHSDRLRLLLLSRLIPYWDKTLLLVQPQTLLRWHHDLFRHYWKHISKPKHRKPRIPKATIDLIKEIANNNKLWGAEKIRGELLKLGISVSKRTIQKHMEKIRNQSNQNWATFLKNHAEVVWSCDFTVVHTLLFRPLYILVFMEHQTRKIVHTAVTTHPTDDWTAQQLKEATPWNKRPKYLIHDNDSKFGKKFSAVAGSSGIEQLKTPFQAPKANATCERLIGTMKRECLDHFLILNQYQLKRIVSNYAAYYNQHRAHQGIEQRIPDKFREPRLSLSNQIQGKVITTPFLNGLHHSYSYALN